jgi:hypothetical protein
MSAPFWDPFDGGEGPDHQESPYDTCKLAGIQVPGLVTVRYTTRQKIEVAKVHGVDGGPTRERGIEAAKVQIAVKIWTRRQWDIFQELLETIWRRPGKGSRLDENDFFGKALRKNGIAIEYPGLPEAGITAIAIESIGSPVIQQDGAGTVDIQALQFIPASTANALRKIGGKKPPAKFREDHLNPKNDVGPDPAVTDNVPELVGPPNPFAAATR